MTLQDELDIVQVPQFLVYRYFSYNTQPPYLLFVYLYLNPFNQFFKIIIQLPFLEQT